MATPNQLLEQYVIETIVKDETAAGLKAAQDSLNKTAEVARKTAEELKTTGEAGGNMATQIAKALPTLDRMAGKADDVTRAYNALKRAQTDLATAQQSADRAMEAGEQDIDKIQRTLAAYAERVDQAAKKLGEQRAVAEANRSATEAWSGAIGEGSKAISAYAQQVAAATQAQSEMQVTMAKAAGSQAELNRILGGNASGDNFSRQLQAARASIDPLYDASMKYASALERIDSLQAINAVSDSVAEAARKRLNTAYEEAVQPMAMVEAEARKVAEVAEIVYNRKILEAEAVTRAAEAQAEYAAVLSQGSLRSSQVEQLNLQTGPAVESASALGEGLDALGAKYETLNSIVAKYYAAQQETATLIANEDMTLAEQAEVLDNLSGKTAAYLAAHNEMAAAAAENAAATKAEADSLEALRLKVDPVYRLSKSYEGAINDLNAALAKGAISQPVYDAQLTAANVGYQKTIENLNKMKDAHNSTGYAARFMGIQFSQAISGFATGQDVLTVILQQGHQLIDVFLAMGKNISELGDAFKTMFNAMGGWPMAALAAAAAALYFLTAAGNEHIGMLNSLKASLQGNHDDYVQMATDVDVVSRKVANSTSLTLAQAREVATTFASNRFFAGTADDLEKLSKMAYNVAAVMKTDVNEAAKILAAGFQDPIAAARKLSETFGTTLTPEFIRNLALIPDVAEQYSKLTTALMNTNGVASAGRDSLSPIREAWTELTNALGTDRNVWESFETWLANDFAHFLRELAGLIRGIGDAWNWATGKVSEYVDAAKKTGMPSDSSPVIQMPGQTETPTTPTVVPNSNTSSTNWSVPGWSAAQTTASQTIAEILRTEFAANTSQIAGVISNAFRESGLTNIGTVHTDSNGFPVGGLMQWNDKYGRLSGLLNSAGTTDLSQVDLPTQVRYMMQEIANNSTWSAMWKEMADKTGADAAALLTKVYERPKNANRDAQTSANIAAQLTGGSSNISSDIINKGAVTEEFIDKSVNGARAENAREYTTELEKLHTAQGQVNTSTEAGQAAYAALDQRIDETRAKQYLNVDAMTTATRASQSQYNANVGLTEGERSLAAAMEARNQVSLHERGSGMTEAESAQVQIEWLRKQRQEINQLTATMDRQSLQQVALGLAYLDGDQAVIDITIRQAAYNEALKHALPNTVDFYNKVNELTAAYLRARNAQVLLKESQTVYQQGRQIDYLKEEITTVGLGEQAQTRYLAVFQATADAHQRDGATLSDLSQKIIANTGVIADQTAAWQKQKNALSEVESFYDTVMGDISNSITDSFKIGSTQALKFKDVATSVVNDIEKEFVKLALVNPLKNLLFGTNSADLSSVGGIIGSLLGNSTTTVGSSSASSGVSALQALGFLGTASLSGGAIQGVSSDASGSGSSSGLSLSTGASLGSLALKGLGIADSGGGILSSITQGVTNWLETNTLTSGITNTISAVTGGAASSGATNLALASMDGLGPATNVAVEAAAQTAASSAIGTVIQSIPYVAALYGVYNIGKQFASGDTRGGIISTLFGSVFSSLLPSHPEHSYQGTEVTTVNGHVVAGTSVSQVQNSDQAVQSVNEFGASLDAYMAKVGVVLTNLDGSLGDVGAGIQGMTQYASPTDPAIFSKLQFTGSSADASNFGVAKGALTDMTFQSIEELNTEIFKIAGFADAASAIGIQLSHVAKDITNIQVGSVTGGNANATTTIQDASGRDVSYKSDLRTALNADLPGQTFADSSALDTEVTKVNTFINATLPQLLSPVEKTTSAITDAADKVTASYSDAIQTSLKYGLDNTAVLQAAEQQALAIVRRTGLEALQDQNSNIQNSMRTTLHGNANYIQMTMDSFDQSARNAMESVKKTWTDTYGDLIASTADFANAMKAESDLLAAQRVDTQFKADNAAEQNKIGMQTTDTKIMARGLSAAGMTGTAELANLDVSQALELSQYKATLESYYGITYVTSQEYLDKINNLEAVQGAERAAIVAKYASDATGAISLAFEKQHAAYATATTNFNAAKDALVNALNAQISSTNNQISALKTNSDALRNASSTITNYTRGLQTATNSPLTPSQQIAAAEKEFSAQLAIMRGPGTVATRTAAASAATTAAGTLLSQAASYYGQASAPYAAVFHMINDNLNSVADGFDAENSTSATQLDILQKQLDVQQAQLDKVTALGKAADADTKSLEATMVSKFNTMILALYDVNQVDPNTTTLADVKRLTDQGTAYGLDDTYAAAAAASAAIAAAAKIVADIKASATSSGNEFLNSGGASGSPFPDMGVQYNSGAVAVRSWFEQSGIEPTLAQLKAATDDFSSGMGGPTVIGNIAAHRYVSGGLVSGGAWNVDSVRAGSNMLAGGEYVVSAPQATRFSDILPQINAGTYQSGMADLISSVKDLKKELQDLKGGVAQNTKVSAQGSVAIVGAINSDQTTSPQATRDNLVRKRANA